MATEIDRINKSLIEIKVESAKQGVMLKTLDKRVDGIDSKISDIHDHIIAEAKDEKAQALKNSTFWRSLTFKVILGLTSLGGVGAVMAKILGE